MPIKNILVSLTSPTGFIVFKYAVCIAKLLNAKLFLVYIIDQKILDDLLKVRLFVEKEVEEYKIDLENQGISLLDRARNICLQKSIENETLLLKGIAHQEVLKIVEKFSIDLIVMGELKEFFSRRDIFYQEEERIIREANCPIIIVKNPELVEKLYKEI